MFCTISITRDCLLSTDESEDFEYLSAANLNEKLDVIYTDVRYKKGEVFLGNHCVDFDLVSTDI